MRIYFRYNHPSKEAFKFEPWSYRKSKAKPWRSVLDQSTDSDEDLKDTEGGVCIFRGYVFAIYI